MRSGRTLVPTPRAILTGIGALVARDDTVAVVWTGHLANGSDYRGLSLYRVADGRVTEIRQALIGPSPD
jgi:hypothetical protein